MSFKDDLTYAIDYELSDGNTEVKEPAVAYESKVAKLPDDIFTDAYNLNQIITKGLPFSIFEKIQAYASLSDTEWADILEISTKSLQRYKKDDKRLKRLHSEKALQIANLYILGHHVFDDPENFSRWLDAPSYALGNAKPKELMKDTFGIELVKTELIHIDQGIFV